MVLLLLTLLETKHFLADWVLQTNYQIANKGKYLHPGGLQHSLTHAILTQCILIGLGYGITLSFTVAFADFMVHYHVDWAKQNLSSGLTTTDKKFWVLMGADQLLHHLTYIAIVFALTR